VFGAHIVVAQPFGFTVGQIQHLLDLGGLGADRAAIVEAILHVLSGADPTCREQHRAFLTSELTAVLDENDRLHAQVARLRLLLRQHGIEPDDGAARSA
jgi:hypothetical protein